MISTTSAIHYILALGGVDSSIIIGSFVTKSTLDRRSATSANNAIAMEEEDDDMQQQPTTCYICYETHDTNNNIPTQRSCACRGTSGYVHTSCLLTYTQQQMIIQQEHNQYSIKKLKPSTLLYCSICKTRYNKPLYTNIRNVILDSITAKSKSERNYKRFINLHTIISIGLTMVYIFDILSILDVINLDNNALAIFNNYAPSFNFIPTMPTLHITQHLLLLSIDILIFLLLTSQVSINTKQYTYCYITFLISRSLFSYKIGLYHGISTSSSGEEMDMWAKMGCNLFKLVYDSEVMSVDERLLLGCADRL